MKTTALVIFLCATIALVAQVDSDSAIQAKIVALEKARNQAYKLGDTKGLGALLDRG